MVPNRAEQQVAVNTDTQQKPTRRRRKRRTYMDGIMQGLAQGRAESLASWKPRDLSEASMWLDWYDSVHQDAPEVDRKLITICKAALAVVRSTPQPRGMPHRKNDADIADLKELLLS